MNSLSNLKGVWAVQRAALKTAIGQHSYGRAPRRTLVMVLVYGSVGEVDFRSNHLCISFYIA